MEFYREVIRNGIRAKDLVKREDYNTMARVNMSSDRIEDHFLWMIKIGIMRREVDGQGLTDRVKLTPLGKSVVGQWEKQIPIARLGDRIIENLRRHRRE